MVKTTNRRQAKPPLPIQPPPAPKTPDRQNLLDRIAHELRARLGGQSPAWWATDLVEETRHYHSWHYIAVQAKAKQFAQGSWAVWAKEQKQKNHGLRQKNMPLPEEYRPGRTPANEDHPLVALLNRPNHAQSKAEFLFRCEQQYAFHGVLRIWVVPNTAGFPCEMWVLPASLCVPSPPTPELPYGGWRIMLSSAYGQLPTSSLGTMSGSRLPTAIGPYSADFVVAKDWVIECVNPHPMYSASGFGPVSGMAMITDLSEQLDRVSWHAFINEIVVGLLLEQIDPHVNPTDEEIKRLETTLRLMHQGTQNSGATLLLPAGLKSAQTKRSAADIDGKDGRKALGDTILGGHGTPGIASGIAEAGSYSAYYSAILQFIELVIEPEMDLVSGACQRFFWNFWPECELELRARNINDPEVLERRLAQDSASGTITFNEYRALRNQPPWPREIGSLPVGTPMSTEMLEILAGCELPGLPREANAQAAMSDSGNAEQSQEVPATEW